MSGAFGEMGNLLKQAQKMQRELDKAREELKGVRVEGTAGGGVVKVEVTGDGEVTSIKIAPDALAAETSMVEDLVLAAVRDGIARATTLRDERLGRVTGGLNLPGIF
jgi:DNA-binding YbaB/EbfC family protein